MARPTTARAPLAPLETALLAEGPGVPEGPTGVLEPLGELLVAVPLLTGGGTPEPEGAGAVPTGYVVPG
jgi:hypothetical protein